MSEIGWAIGALVLVFLLAQLRRRSAARNGPSSWQASGHVSLDDMSELVAELTPTLRETAMVTAPQVPVDRGHIWASPCGKRVYLN